MKRTPADRMGEIRSQMLDCLGEHFEVVPSLLVNITTEVYVPALYAQEQRMKEIMDSVAGSIK